MSAVENSTNMDGKVGLRLGIMQPYFLSYIGYFQLISAVDVFVVYDNIKYTKKGWINRNRMLLNGADAVFSLPLKKASDFLNVDQRELSGDFDALKLLGQFRGAYVKAPNFAEVFPLLERILTFPERNLFRFIHHAIVMVCRHLGLETEIRVSSDFAVDPDLKGQDKVLALCRAAGADVYINAIGGTELYTPQAFAEHDVELRFIRSKPFEYEQFGAPFVPWLSIIDVLMFNPLDLVQARVANHFDLI